MNKPAPGFSVTVPLEFIPGGSDTPTEAPAKHTKNAKQTDHVMMATKPRVIHLKVMASPRRHSAVSPLVFVSFVCFAGTLLNR